MRDRSYVKRLQKEVQSEQGNLFFLYDAQGNLAGLQGLAGKEQQVLYGEDPWLVWKEKKPRIMARITNLKELLSMILLKEEGTLDILLDVEDRLVPENEGYYLWKLSGQGSQLLDQPRAELQAAEAFHHRVTLRTGIGDLTSWLFGYIPAETLWPDMSSQEIQILSRVKLLDPIWLDELV